MQKYTPLFFLFAILSCSYTKADEIIAEYVSNYDGDTFTVNLPELRKMDKKKKYRLFWDNISVRLGGIDTPEMKGKCPEEKELAQKAKAYVKDKLQSAKKITLENMDKDKYFRILAEIYVDEVPLAQMLMQEGYAVPYSGGTKDNVWCKEPQKVVKKVKSKKP